MSIDRLIINVFREIDRANKRAIREQKRLDRELERNNKRALREMKQLAREEEKQQKQELVAALEEEKRIFEKRSSTRREMRLKLINKVR